jgi:translation initiation factor 1
LYFSFLDIRNQQRNNRKTITTVEGIPEKFSTLKLLRHWKQTFNTNGTVIKDKERGKIIQIQGDSRKEIAEFLYYEGIAERDEIKVHGV